MIYSKTAHQAGGTGFLFNGDPNAPSDAVEVLKADVLTATNLPEGMTYDFDATGEMTVFPTPPTALTQMRLIAQYEAALDAHLDSVAKQHRYDNRVTFALRAGYPGPYQSAGLAYGSWMDDCNQKAFALLERVIAGTEDMPTKADFIDSLPIFVLP